MQISRDDRPEYSAPGHGLRRVIQQSQLNTTFLQSTNVSTVVTAGFRVMPYQWESSMNIGAGIFLGTFSSIWCLVSVASICNHTSQRKGEQSFGYDAYEWTQKLRLLHDALYPFLHST